MRIIITEKQLKRLLEGEDNGAPTLKGGDLVKYPGSQISTTANVTRPDGEEEYGLPKDTNDIASNLTSNNPRRTGYGR